MKRILYPLFFIVIAFLAACTDVATNGDQGAISDEVRLKGDHTVYGLACDGCSDSVIVVLRNEGGDPVRYNSVRSSETSPSATNWPSWSILATRMRRWRS